MKLRKLSINNFRGIHNLDWTINSDMVCLIGPGDSTKSTILLALEYLFSPTYNLTISDIDFYEMNVSDDNPITIEAIVTGFSQPSESDNSLISEDSFGLALGFWDPLNQCLSDTQKEHNGTPFEPALRIRLTIGRDLEPSWQVMRQYGEPLSISAVDRRKLGVASIGQYFDSDLSWGRNSALTRLTQKEDLSKIPKILAESEREILTALRVADLSSLSDAIETANSAAKSIGLNLRQLQASIHPMKVNLKQGAISLFDGNLPFSLRGEGSRRLMAMAIHKASVPEGAVILIDEIENSLEPYRLRHLIRHLRPKVNEKHQVIFTTHSPVAVVECNASELYVVRSCSKGAIRIIPIGEELQGLVRSIPEAFLCRKVVVCEGKTEAGFLIGLDMYYWQEKHKKPGTSFIYLSMAEAGCVPIESPKCGGSEAPKYAVHLAKLGYQVAYFGDSDCDLNPSKEEMEQNGVEKVFLWEDNLEIERRLCLDLPDDGLSRFIELAISLSDSEKSFWDKLNSPKFIEKCCQASLQNRIDSIEGLLSKPRQMIGCLADMCEWYKRMDKGKELGRLVSKYLDEMNGKPTSNLLCELERWCYGE